jgi:hypothetical protein
MRPGLRDTGWVGSLFDEPIAPSKPVLTKLQFSATGPFPDDKGELVHYAHETWRKFELNGHMVEEFVSTDRPISKDSEFGVDMKTVDDAREAAGGLPSARCSVQNGIRTYEDPALQKIEKTLGPFYCWNDKSPFRGRLCTHLHEAPCSYGQGTPCEFSAILDPATPGLNGPEGVEPTKKPAKAKKSRATSRANRNRDLEALAPHGCLGTKPCLCYACVNQEICHHCEEMNKSVCGHYHAHTIECPAYSKAEGEGWTCADCLCPKCANNGESCHTCEGPVYCSKHGGKMGGCPDFRAKDGEEQPTLPVKATKQPKPKKQPKLTRADYDNNPLPGSNADTCSHCDCETCGLNQAHLNYTDKEWANCPPCGCDQCLGKPELQPTTLCGRKAALTVEVLGNTESQLPREQQHMVTLQRYVRQFCGDCKCLTCGRAYQNCAMNGDEPYHICSICTLEHAHHHKPYPAIIKDCEHWIDKATFPADIYAPGQGPCPETACELRYNGEGGPCLCHSCKYGPGSCDTSCNIPGYPMETGQYGCEWYAKKEVATVDVVTQPAAELDVPDLVKVGDLVTRLHTRGYVYDIYKVTRVEKTDAGWQICGDRWDDFRHPKRKNVSKNEPIIRWDVTGWKAEEGKVVPLREKVVEGTFGAKYNEKYADEQLIVLTLEQVEQLVAVEEAEDVNGPTNYTRVYLKPAGAKGTLNDLHSDWPLLGHARFVDTSAAAVAKIPSGRRSEVCQDEPECEHCLCYTCQHQKACRLDNTLNCCSPCKTSGGAHHHKAVDCEGYAINTI